MQLSDFDFHLPEELIAQKPIEPRDHSRLLILDTRSQKIVHDYFYNLPKYLSPEDVLVFNKSKVFPARLFGKKSTGGKVEILLLRHIKNSSWEYLSHPGIKEGSKITFDQGVTAKLENGLLKFSLNYSQLMSKLLSIGHIPIPPYISPEERVSEPKLRRRYQTVYATEIGSVAAPTAGFHFTKKLLAKIPNKEFVTLHVGLGTFRPVKTENITEHQMHSEWYSVSGDTVSSLIKSKKEGKRIIAVGTTTVRTLETWANTGKTEGETNIFIYPGYKFKIVDAMITNFHLPKSTLLMLVSAFADRELIIQDKFWQRRFL